MSPNTVAIDLDGVIFEVYWGENLSGYDIKKFGKIIPGAKRFMEDMFNAGHYTIIHTCRVSPDVNMGYGLDYLLGLVEGELDRHFLPYNEIWIGEGKPIAHLYIDDRAVRFTGWDDVRAFLERNDVI